MSTHIILLLLANTIYNVRGRCSRTRKPPEVTVADLDHLLVDWTKSFENCNSSKVQNAIVKVSGRNPMTQNVRFGEMKAKVMVDPCLHYRKIELKLKYGDEKKVVWSHPASYNNYNSKINVKELYSGLLQEQVLDKTCVKEDGELFLPEIPEELKMCVKNYTATRPPGSVFSFEIQDQET